MLYAIDNKEQERVALQASLDAEKSQAERNRFGQFATPTSLAEDMLRYAASLLPPDERIRFLDPAIGTGSFYSALLKVFPKNRIVEALGFEVDPHYGRPAVQLWKDTGLTLQLSDFTRAEPSASYNLLVCNPPYVRHHHLSSEDKARLQVNTQQAGGMRVGGLAGLYCHFLGLAHAWMAEQGYAGWLIPSEFMDVNYGQAVKQYLLGRVTLLHIHRFDPNELQFADALVSSAVVWFKNEPPPPNHKVKFSFGGTLLEPKLMRLVPVRDLAHERKWTRFPAAEVRSRGGVVTLGDFFQIKRGIVTGDNRFFILNEEEIAARGLPMEVFNPILPGPRYLQQNEIRAREDGTPDIKRRLFLLDTKLPEDEIRRKYAALADYLEEGKARGLHERYICVRRSPWYAQENRPPAPIVCTYLGRGDVKTGRPFRFILNASRATVANVYLAMYPTSLISRETARDPHLLRNIWIALNQLPPESLLGEGRVYGGGLHKLEPGELGNVSAAFLLDLLPHANMPKKSKQLELCIEV